MKSSARVVVIGGGVVGVSVLYHLAKIGWTDVVLVEKNELTSGSTWHAAGGVTTLNSDANVSKLQKYTFDLYRELEAVTGQSCGIHHNGGIYLAASDGQMDFLKLIHSRARYLKMDTEMISVAEAKKRNVLIDEQYFKGALWREDGGYVDPWLVTQAYVSAAKAMGAESLPLHQGRGPEPAAGPFMGRRDRQGDDPRRARRQRRRALGARGRQARRPRACPCWRWSITTSSPRPCRNWQGWSARSSTRPTSRARSTCGRRARACCSAPTSRTASAVVAGPHARRLPQPASARRSRPHRARNWRPASGTSPPPGASASRRSSTAPSPSRPMAIRWSAR